MSLAEYYLLCSAGYHVTLPPDDFVAHACSASSGDPRGVVSLPALAAAFARLQARGLLVCLTQAAIRDDDRRRATSSVPEVRGPRFQAGHVDFTDRGYAVYREVARQIHGDDFLARMDTGFTLDADAGRFDVYAATVEECSRQMDVIEADGDAFTGVESVCFVSRRGPTEIGEWRPNRFVLRATGYHGILRYVIDADSAGGPAG